MTQKLFAVYLGGRAPKANIELHDVVFVVGESIEQTYPQLLELWFGSPEGLHIDCWIELDVVDGYRVRLVADKPVSEQQLYFINLGAYHADHIGELHATAFMVAQSSQAVKARAKKTLLPGTQALHTDDLYEVDDCMPLAHINGYYIALEPGADHRALQAHNGYLPLPKALVGEWKNTKR